MYHLHAPFGTISKYNVCSCAHERAVVDVFVWRGHPPHRSVIGSGHVVRMCDDGVQKGGVNGSKEEGRVM